MSGSRRSSTGSSGARLALVDNRPGVTRDGARATPRSARCASRSIDTAGLEVSDEASLAGRMRAQTETAIAQADLILFMIDARARPYAGRRALRRGGAPLRQAASSSSPTRPRAATGMTGAYEGFDLGLGDPVPISAEHGEGMADLAEAIAEIGPETARAARGGRRRDGCGRHRRGGRGRGRRRSMPASPGRCASP